jgi:Family of unknown function (DUF5681)
MARRGQSDRRKKSASNPAANHSVGYGRPPLSSRFKPGTSGNPKGRPKGRKNLKTLIKEAMTASILIQEGQNSRRVSRIEGVVLRQLQSALKQRSRRIGGDQDGPSVEVPRGLRERYRRNRS